MKSATRGDHVAFERLYELTSPKLFGCALKILKDQSLAEEILQASFLKIWQHLKTYDETLTAPMTWMASIVRNSAIDELRKRGKWKKDHKFPLEKIVSNEENALRLIEKNDVSIALRSCLNELEKDKRRMVELAYLQDFSRQELALLFNMPEGTVKSWLRRALLKLRTALEESDSEISTYFVDTQY